MAKIEWTDRFLYCIDYFISHANMEYGKATALRWADEIAAFEKRVCLWPTSYPPERLLLGKRVLYRGCHVMNRRFKLIYYYDETGDVVHLIDIWDTRMNPKALISRIK